MVIEELKNIVHEQKAKNVSAPYIKNSLKEYLQVYLLYFIYTSQKYMKNLIFTGGTCLRHFYGLSRLSEDLDFDSIQQFEPKSFLSDVKDFFEKKYRYHDVEASLKQQGKQALFKFPVLKKLGLATDSESDLLYVKVDITDIPSQNYEAITTSDSKYGLNYVARHYDLPSLMAGKIHAILTRRYLRGEQNRESIKGRDYFDLLWFVKKGVTPNIARLSDMLGRRITANELKKEIDSKIETFVEKHKSAFEADLLPLIDTPEIIKTYINNYYDEYKRNVEHTPWVI